MTALNLKIMNMVYHNTPVSLVPLFSLDHMFIPCLHGFPVGSLLSPIVQKHTDY